MKYKTQLHKWADLAGRKITAVIEDPDGASDNCALVIFTEDGCWAALLLNVELERNLITPWTALAQRSADKKRNDLTYYVSIDRLMDRAVITAAEGDLLRQN